MSLGYDKQQLIRGLLGDDVNTVILSSVENCAGVVCGCIPTLLPIWRSLRHGTSWKSMQQVSNNSTSKNRLGVKLSALKRSLWSASRPRKLERRNNSESLKRLHTSTLEEAYPGNPVHNSALQTDSTPHQEPNCIRVTTDVEHFQIVAPGEDARAETCTSEW